MKIKNIVKHLENPQIVIYLVNNKTSLVDEKPYQQPVTHTKEFYNLKPIKYEYSVYPAPLFKDTALGKEAYVPVKLTLYLDKRKFDKSQHSNKYIIDWNN